MRAREECCSTPLAVEGVPVPPAPGDRAEPRKISRTPSASPPRYRGGTRSDCLVRSMAAPVVSRMAACAAPPGRARKASHGHVVAPQVVHAGDALAGEQRRRTASCSAASRWCPPTGLAAYQQQADAAAAAVRDGRRSGADIVEGIVKSPRCALAPPVPRCGVVVAGEAHRQREQVGPLEREVGRMEGAQAAPQGRHVAAPPQSW